MAQAGGDSFRLVLGDALPALFGSRSDNVLGAHFGSGAAFFERRVRSTVGQAFAAPSAEFIASRVLMTTVGTVHGDS